MKNRLLILMIFLGLMHLPAGFAQVPASGIAALDVEIWPDYDRPSVLVLLTGRLPEETEFPASVSLPLPKGAQLNAVARIDGQDGKMKDDIFASTDPSGTLTFITPDLRFRVEYYLPYTGDNLQRSFDYTWSAAISVNNFQLRVQRPTAASVFSTEPATANVTRSSDGFEYHTFTTRAVPAGQPFSVQVVYSMATAQLSAAGIPSPTAGTQSPAQPDGPGMGSGAKWALAAVVSGGLLIIGALVWQIASRRGRPAVRQAGESQGKKRSRVNFCGNCGEPVGKGDKFCRGCGSKV